MFIQLWNSLLEKLKTTKQKIIYTNVTKDISMKKKNDIKNFKYYNRRKYRECLPFYKAKLNFAHAPFNKNKN